MVDPVFPRLGTKSDGRGWRTEGRLGPGISAVNLYLATQAQKRNSRTV